MEGYTVGLTTKENTAENAIFHLNEGAKTWSCMCQNNFRSWELLENVQKVDRDTFVPNHRFVERLFDLDSKVVSGRG